MYNFIRNFNLCVCIFLIFSIFYVLYLNVFNVLVLIELQLSNFFQRTYAYLE